MNKQSVTKGFAVLSLASLVVKVLSFLYIPFLIAIIGDEGNGIYAAAYTVYVFIYVIANSGVPVAISKSIAELVAVGNYRDAERAFKIARSYLILIGFILSIGMFVFAQPLANAVKIPDADLAIKALSPTLLIVSLVSAYRGYFQGMGNMTPTAISQVLEQVVNVICTLLFASMLMVVGLKEACAGGTIGTSMGALGAAIVLIYMFLDFKKNTKKDRTIYTGKRYSYKELRNMIIRYSIPLTVCVASQYAGSLIDLSNTISRLMAAGFDMSFAKECNSYLFKYQQLINVPISLVAALAATILPAISGLVATKEKDKLQSQIDFAIKLSLLITLPAAVGLSVMSGPVYEMLRYSEGVSLMFYGAGVLVLMSLMQIQTTILQGAGKLYTATVNVLIGLGVKIIVNYFFIGIRDINIHGAIIGSYVGFTISIVLNVMTIRKHVGVKVNLLRSLIKPLVASLVMGALAFATYKGFNILSSLLVSQYWANALSVFGGVLTGGLAYVVILMLIGGIDKGDMELMPGKLKKIIPKRLLKS